MTKYTITMDEYNAVKATQKKTNNIRIYKILEVIALRYKGYTDEEISFKLDFHRQSIGRMIRRFKEKGLEEYIKNRYGGNNRNLSIDEENSALDEVRAKAEAGQLTGVDDVREALEKRLGRKSRTGYVYDVLHRHEWRDVMPRPQHPEAASQEEQETAKKEIQEKVQELCKKHEAEGKKTRIMFQDEAGFGRINAPKRCWCPPGFRPVSPSLRVREYKYAYGTVDPISGDHFFWILPYSNTYCMNFYLEQLGKEYEKDIIVLCCDQAPWHTTGKLVVPDNIILCPIPPRTPEMNPIEQIWKETRKRGFSNEYFDSLEKVIDRLCETLNSLDNDTVKHITQRRWIKDIYINSLTRN